MVFEGIFRSNVGGGGGLIDVTSAWLGVMLDCSEWRRHSLVRLLQYLDEVGCLVEVLLGEECVGCTTVVTPRRPPYPVHVILTRARIVEIDDVPHVTDV